MPETTPIPKSPAHFVGLMNLRGDIISIIDMRKKLSIRPTKIKEEAVIIVDIGDYNIGVVVDCINSVLAFAKTEMCEMPVISEEMNNKYIVGVFKKEHSLTAVLDIANILDVTDHQTVQSQFHNEEMDQKVAA